MTKFVDQIAIYNFSFGHFLCLFKKMSKNCRFSHHPV